jgi:hypothetical protein
MDMSSLYGLSPLESETIDMFIRLPAFPFNNAGQLLAKLTVALH